MDVQRSTGEQNHIPRPLVVVSANLCHSPLHSIHKHLKSRSSVKSLGISDDMYLTIHRPCVDW